MRLSSRNYRGWQRARYSSGLPAAVWREHKGEVGQRALMFTLTGRVLFGKTYEVVACVCEAVRQRFTDAGGGTGDRGGGVGGSGHNASLACPDSAD